MFARILHSLHIFPLLMFSLATVKDTAFFEIFDFKDSALALSIFALAGFVSSLGEPSKLKKLAVVSSLVAGLLIALNFLTHSPTLGVLNILAVLLALANILSSHKSKQDPYFIPKNKIVLSFIIYLMGLYVVTPQEIRHMSLLSFGLVMAGVSVTYINLISVGLRKSLDMVAITMVAAAFVAGYLDQSHYLYIGVKVLFFSSFISLGYLFLNKKTLSNIDTGYANFFKKPELVIVGYFVIIALIGAFLLQLPQAQTGNIQEGHNFLDSLFTAMSAVSVTGLIVLDTPVDFTFFGQAMILLLIQLGGLGITSLSAWILLILRSGRLNISHEDVVNSMTGSLNKFDIKSTVARIFSYFIFVELIGALLLVPSFIYAGDSFFKALWRAVFTSISAFCNAGFALQTQSLIDYQEQSFVLIVVSLLIIAGGFAPLLVLGLPQKIKNKKVGLQEKIVLSSTAALIIIGFIYFILVEWGHSLGNLGVYDKFVNAFFHSVTTRTAGFNSIDLIQMREVTQFFYTILMFIGGNPGSAAGGIKTVTIAVLVIAAYNALKESGEARVFFRKIPSATVFRALLILLLGACVHFVFFFFLSVTQEVDAVSLIFETFSALGTVGLSIGATSQLDDVGKVLIMFSMLAGRVGPLTFILLLTNRQTKSLWKVASEDVSIT